ncbi:TatD family hydrolase [Litorilituus sediminis]|uniref:YchF/TatD family DNA exonuclease n=1 Tax=Litorilituus sediminis TaxID=718192 RepID=A0A4P6P5A1_9GAMM|nr:YchF/TatD family DNA exonuclease [Litorilituus sediminis]QBG34542.1 YchF/TatD family DNA exonuclease [Litorilituus sediminis]
MYIDSHCHLDRLDLSLHDNNLDNVIAAATKAQVTEMLCVSVTLKDFPSMLEKTKHYDNVMLTCGAHPLNQEGAINPEELNKLAQHDKVIAIGETGLDYFYAPETKALQLDSFKKHIGVAKALNKPLIIHTRDAQQDTLNMLRQEGADSVGGILHCFTESWEMAEQAIDLGFYISFSGIVTFKNAKALREVAALVPEDKFLIETDAPYLAPVPHRGKENQPAYVVEVAKHLASIRGQSVQSIAEQSTDNFNRLFKRNG